MRRTAGRDKFVTVVSLALMIVHASEAVAFQPGGVELELSPEPMSTGVSLEGLEVTQAIQTMSTSNLSINNSVPLIANKRTMVRAYFHTHSVELTVTLASGQLTATHTAYPGTTFTVNSTPASIVVDSIESLSAKRNDLQKSLNFILDSELIVPGILTLRVDSLKAPNGTTINCGLCRTISPELVTFRTSPPLRLRIMGFNVHRNGTFFPRDYTLDLAAIRSWLQRAYPIAQIESPLPDDPSFFYDSDQIDADGTRWDLWEPDFDTCLRAIAKIRDVRNADLAANPNPPVHEEIFRTHYYGVLHDNGTTALAGRGPNYVEGCSDYVPFYTPDPSSIAFAPTGPWSWGWDTDGSYGDWKAGHEIGHTLGRYHLESSGLNPPPSVPSNVCIIPSSYLEPRPASDGMVSLGFPNEPEYVGLDLGDSIALSSGGTFAPQRQSVPGDWNDVMTYCPYRWINQYTYEGIRERLEEENACLEVSDATASSLSASSSEVSRGNGDMATDPATEARDHARRWATLCENKDPKYVAICAGTLATKIREHQPVSKLRSMIRDVAKAMVAACAAQARDGKEIAQCLAEFSKEKIAAVESSFRLTSSSIMSTPISSHAVLVRKGDFLNVTGIVNFKAAKGRINAVSHAKEIIVKPQIEDSPVHVRITDVRGKIMDIPIAVQYGSRHYSKKPTLGLIEKAIPFTSDIAKIELMLSGNPLDARAKSQNIPVVDKLRLNTIGGQRPLALTWVATDDDPGDITKLTYTVQISSDSRKTWQTIAVGLTKPEFLIDPRRLQGLARVDFRVVASDGFNESKAEFATFCPKAKACSE